MTDATDGDARGAHTDFGVGDGDESIERLWTPYRMRYLVDSPPVPEGSTAFLEIPKLADEDGLIVARGEHCYVVMNLFPYNPGHVLVCPYRHVPLYVDLTGVELAEFTALTRAAIRTLERSSRPHGFNLGMNQGAVAGAGAKVAASATRAVSTATSSGVPSTAGRVRVIRRPSAHAGSRPGKIADTRRPLPCQSSRRLVAP